MKGLFLCLLLFVSISIASPSDSFYALASGAGGSDLVAATVSSSGVAAEWVDLQEPSVYCNQISSAPGGVLYVAVQGDMFSDAPSKIARVSSSTPQLQTWTVGYNTTFGNIVYDNVSGTRGWVYTVVRVENTNSDTVYNIVGLNPTTSDSYIVKQYLVKNPPAWTCLDDGGLAIDSKGWLSYFISTYDNEESGTLIWNYNVLSNNQNFVTLNTSQTWYTQGFQYSSVLRKHVAVGGRNAINYQYLSIVTYSAGDSQITPLCNINLATLPIFGCIGQSFLGSTGSDIYMVDCYYQAIMRFDFNCTLLSFNHLSSTADLSLVNAPFAVYRP